MKRIYYYIFKHDIFSRYKQLEDKRTKRADRLRLAEKELKDWYDIPLNQQYSTLFKILSIKDNKSSRKFITMIAIGHYDFDAMCKKLPL